MELNKIILKRITFILLVSSCLPAFLFAQEQILTVVDEIAEYPGGKPAFFEFISNTIVYPQTALAKGATGKIYARFVVNTDGSVSNPQIIKGIENCEECDPEVIRMINLMPDWKPAKNDGEIVASYYVVPVDFQASEKTIKQAQKAAKKKK